jgi:signal transduction histidine kinase
MNLSARVNSHSMVARSDRDDLSEQFRTIAEIGGDVAFIVDCRSCSPSYISPAVATLLGYAFADFQQQFSAADAGGPLGALCAGLPERLQRFCAGDDSRRQLVRRFDLPHRDGRSVPIEIISTLLADADGVPVSLVGIMRDLSAAREHEAAQRRFASMLNHEFRTPLSTIDGAIQRLEATGAQADDATRKRYRRIAGAVDRLIGMLDEYLSPDRMQAIGRDRQPTSIAPRLLLEEGACQVRAVGRPVTLELDDLPDTVRCDPQGLRLALKVLVDNAILYSPAGSAIGIAGRRTERGVELLVRDAGDGVPEDEADQVFAKGFRGRNVGGRPGSGLGLYLARSVVEVHGGSIGMRNVAGGGAQFWIWLPVQGGAGKNVATSEHSSDNPGHKQGRLRDRQYGPGGTNK